MIEIKTEYAYLINPFRGNGNDGRYPLCGFYVEPAPQGGVLIIATNGHVMGVFHDETGTCDAPVIIALDKPMVSACRPTNKKIDQRLRVADNVATVLDSDRSALVSASRVEVDGTFPEWRRAVPNQWEMKLGASCFGTPVLKAFAGFHFMSICGGGPLSSCTVSTERADFFGVIMPMRCDRPNDFPDWYLSAKEDEKEEAAD